jgi:hypothetical protein
VNILLISTNRSKQTFPVIPLGACIVAEAAEQDYLLMHFFFVHDQRILFTGITKNLYGG